jgi:hypothetical protein
VKPAEPAKPPAVTAYLDRWAGLAASVASGYSTAAEVTHLLAEPLTPDVRQFFLSTPGRSAREELLGALESIARKFPDASFPQVTAKGQPWYQMSLLHEGSLGSAHHPRTLTEAIGSQKELEVELRLRDRAQPLADAWKKAAALPAGTPLSEVTKLISQQPDAETSQYLVRGDGSWEARQISAAAHELLKKFPDAKVALGRDSNLLQPQGEGPTVEVPLKRAIMDVNDYYQWRISF